MARQSGSKLRIINEAAPAAPEYSGTPRSSRRNGGFRNSYRGERDRSDRSGFRGNRGGFRSDRGERWGERSRRDDRKKRF